MSRGFVKEDDLEHAGTDIPERPVSRHANYVTLSGYHQLEKLAAELEQQRQTLSLKKEDDLEHAGTDIPERPVSRHANYVTLSGYHQLEKLAAELEQQRQTLSLKKEEQTAMQQLAMVNRDLRYVAARLESALVTQPDSNSKSVVFGAIVTVEDEVGNTHIYEIVGEDEADIKANKISYTSPLGHALIGYKLEDTVTWLRPAGNQLLTITAIHYTN